YSIIAGRHTWKMGGEWVHTLNDQVFRGFFTGRYIFDSVTGFLRYASQGPGFGPAANAAHLLLFLQGAGPNGPATDAAGASSITTNGVQQQTIAGGLFANPTILPTWPGLVTPTASSCGSNPFPCFSGVRVFSRDYANPRIYTTNVGFEQELAPNWAFYADFTHSKGVHLTRFLNVNRKLDSSGNPIFGPQLGEVQVTSSPGKS